MRRAWRALVAAFATFSALPLGRLASHDAPDALALSFLPLVGAVTGALAGYAGFAAFAWLHLGWSFVIAWAAGIALTGAIHLDGFLDCCDALFASAPVRRRLEIMRDPHHGSFAVVGMALLTVFWLAALAPIAPSALPLVLAYSAATARLAAVANAWFFGYEPGGSMVRAFAQRPNVPLLAAWFALVEVLAYAIGLRATIVAPVAIAVTLAAGAWAGRRLGGVLTGDVYGALTVSAEVGVLVLLCLVR